MKKSKIESDIVILDDLLLQTEQEIISIENQIELKELNTIGDDDYFDWRTRAVCAINYKRSKCNSISRQANFWRDKLKKIKLEDKLKFKKKNIALTEKLIAEKTERQKLQVQSQKNAREHKLKMHQASQNKELLVSLQFRRLIKEMLGENKYIELIRKAELMALNNNYIGE